jgi:hypothetical protein
MSVPKPTEVYLDSKGNRFTVVGMEFKEDGIYTLYRDEKFKSYSCTSEAFLERFTILKNYDSSSRNNKVVY